MDTAQEIHEVAAQKRFSSGEAYFFNTKRHQHLYQTNHFLVGKQLLAGNILDTFLWHAIEAAEVAAIGHCQTQIIDLTSVIIE